MGMYDTVDYWGGYCRKCSGPLRNLQTKDGACDGSVVPVESVRNCYAICAKCETWNEFKVTATKVVVEHDTEAELAADYRHKLLREEAEARAAEERAKQEPQVCQNCGVEPGTELWGGTNDATSLARNPWLAKMWCKRCVLQAQRDYMRDIASKLPEVERLLAELQK